MTEYKLSTKVFISLTLRVVIIDPIKRSGKKYIYIELGLLSFKFQILLCQNFFCINPFKHNLEFLQKSTFIFLSGLLGVLSASVSLFVSPFVIAVCRRKSTRLTSVVGGLIVTLGTRLNWFYNYLFHFWKSYESKGLFLNYLKRLGII